MRYPAYDTARKYANRRWACLRIIFFTMHSMKLYTLKILGISEPNMPPECHINRSPEKKMLKQGTSEKGCRHCSRRNLRGCAARALAGSVEFYGETRPSLLSSPTLLTFPSMDFIEFLGRYEPWNAGIYGRFE